MNESADKAETTQAILDRLHSGDCDGALQLAQENLEQWQEDPEYLLLMHAILKARGDLAQAIEFAFRAIRSDPHSREGYIRATEGLIERKQSKEALELIGEGVHANPRDPEILITALRLFTSHALYNDAITIGRHLHSLEPHRPEQYEPFVLALAKANEITEALSVIDAGLRLQPNNLHFADLKAALLARAGKYEQCKWHLYTSLQNSPGKLNTKILTECLYHLETNQKQKSDSKARIIGCDIICIASDEAPYLHEFIHHHLYLGFRNIFIGINNLNDATRLIGEKISQRHQNVHIISVDPMIDCFNQYGCYHYLFDRAVETSNSSHCLFIDVDEFWVSNPFPTRISDFIQASLPFDVYSFYWLCAHNDRMFSGPLQADTIYTQSNWIKSLFCYKTPTSRIGVHGPILDTLTKQPITKIEGQNNRSISLTIYGLEICGYNQESSHFDAPKNHGAVIHMINRSELEYCHRLFKTHANEEQPGGYFKTNRYGWEEQASVNGRERSFYFPEMPNEAEQLYNASLEKFIQHCNISSDISIARAGMTEESIHKLIASTPRDIIKRDADLARQIFRGTRFLPSIEAILNE